MRRASSAAVALLVVGLLGLPVLIGAAPSPSPSPVPISDALLRAALDAPTRISYVGELQTTRWGPNSAAATLQRVEHLAPGLTRRTFLAPESLYGEYDITTGSTTMRFDPHRALVLVTDSPAALGVAAADSNISLLLQNYRALGGPVESVAGRSATSLWLVNRYTGERSMRLWIDNATKIVLAKEAYHGDGSLAWRQRFDAIRFTAEIPPGVFATEVPSGFHEVEARRYADLSSDLQRTAEDAGFRSVGPHYLPEGFGIIGADLSTVKGMRTLHFLYSDGIRNLSLFENRATVPPDFGALKPALARVGQHDAQYVKDGPTTLLAWRDGGLAFTLVGDLDLKELVKIAASVP